jgi:hypothetical protein
LLFPSPKPLRVPPVPCTWGPGTTTPPTPTKQKPQSSKARSRREHGGPDNRSSLAG